MIFPSYVGYDIGCGVLAVPTSFKADAVREHAHAIFDQLYRDIPVGFSHNKTPVSWEYFGMSLFGIKAPPVFGVMAPL